MFVSTVRVLLAALLSIATVACGGSDDDPSPTGPTAPTTITLDFSGTIGRNGANTHPFTTDSGTVTATIMELAPDSAAIVGLTLGTWNGAACQTIIANDRATKGITVTGVASGSGNLCVRVFDAAGSLTQPTDYVVSVVHPQR